MHPVVIMAYDKSPAINKAVAALEEAGMEVRVLNTNHAKLADFLGALAGEDDDEDQEHSDDVPPAEDTPPVDVPPEDEDTPPADDEEQIATEALQLVLSIDDEQIPVTLVEGASELVPNGRMIGSKTAYMINESHFSFWPAQADDGLFDMTHNVQVKIDPATAIFTDVKIAEAAEAPMLKLNQDVFDTLFEAAKVMKFAPEWKGELGGEYTFTDVKKHGKDGKGNTVYSGKHHNGHASVFVVNPEGTMVANSIGDCKTMDDAEKKAKYQVDNNKEGHYWDSKDPMKSFYLAHRFKTKVVK